MLTRYEGIFAEPGSCASVAGLIKLKDQVYDGSTIVCILTGNGLKDPNCAIEHSNSKIHKTSSDINDIIKVIEKC